MFLRDGSLKLDSNGRIDKIHIVRFAHFVELGKYLDIDIHTAISDPFRNLTISRSIAVDALLISQCFKEYNL